MAGRPKGEPAANRTIRAPLTVWAELDARAAALELKPATLALRLIRAGLAQPPAVVSAPPKPSAAPKPPEAPEPPPTFRAIDALPFGQRDYKPGTFAKKGPGKRHDK